MAGFGDLVQKAFYLGVGIASYAGEKAGGTLKDTLKDLQGQAQKLVDELVVRGELTTEEAQRLVNDMVSRAQGTPSPGATTETAPRPIEILDDDEDTALTQTQPTEAQQAEALRRQVEALRRELEQLKRQS